MYDRVVDVPRLLCMYGEGRALPDPVLNVEMRDLTNESTGADTTTAGVAARFYRVRTQ